MTNQITEQLIARVCALPLQEQAHIIDALFKHTMGADYGAEDPEGVVAAAWDMEIAKRIKDVQSGTVKTIPADIAESMIRGNK